LSSIEEKESRVNNNTRVLDHILQQFTKSAGGVRFRLNLTLGAYPFQQTRSRHPIKLIQFKIYLKLNKFYFNKAFIDNL
jgi:hypothetical protein